MLPVIFRMWNGVHGDVFALFPTIHEGDGCILSYQRIGQHCAADYNLCIKRSRPATLTEYAALADELTAIGYSFRVAAEGHGKCGSILMPKTVRLYDIKWDTLSDLGSYAKGPSAKSLGLPSEVVVTVNRRWNPETEAADHLSENHGFCVLGYSWEEVKK